MSVACPGSIPGAGHLFRYLTNQPPKANSAFHPFGVGKWVPASAGKAKAGMVHSVSGWTRCVQVKLSDPLRTRAITEHLTDVFIHIHVYLTLPSDYIRRFNKSIPYIIPSLLIPRYFSDTGIPRIPWLEWCHDPASFTTMMATTTPASSTTWQLRHVPTTQTGYFVQRVSPGN